MLQVADRSRDDGREAVKLEPVTISDILDAVRDVIASKKMTWRLGDLLVLYCGAPTSRGVHTGSGKLLKKVTTQIADTFGEEAENFGFEHLRQLRRLAATFPDGTRVPSVDWAVHRAAKNSKTLKLAREEARRTGRRLTVKFVNAFGRSREGKPGDWVTQLEELRRASTVCAARSLYSRTPQ